jgi:two-component sensor histidine kinase
MHHAPGSETPATRHVESLRPQIRLERVVDAGAAEIRAARLELRRHLEDWQLGDRLANAVLDVAHELIVNAHQHAQPPVRLTVAVGVSAVRVEVRDGSAQPTRLLPYRPGVSEHGLGLQLVRQLSTQWGQTLDEPGTASPGGKTVWAVFDRPNPPSG